MNWIKTHRGDFCNLSRATGIEVKRPVGEESYRFEAVAVFEGGQRVVIAAFDTGSEIHQYMRGIGQMLAAASCNLNQGAKDHDCHRFR